MLLQMKRKRKKSGMGLRIDLKNLSAPPPLGTSPGYSGWGGVEGVRSIHIFDERRLFESYDKKKPHV